MHIKLLSNVLHDGEPLPAGMVCHDVPEEAALPLIASGAAVEIKEEPLDVRPGPLPPAAENDAAASAPAVPPGPADVAPVVDPSVDSAPVVEPDAEAKAETGKKAAKAEGK